jgi:trehalose/maltose hydrolase-like predicted phosphorylase
MAGTWMSVVEGMAGVRVHESGLEINPTIPEAWQSYTFRILYQTIPLEVSIDKTNVTVKNIGTSSINCTIMNNAVQIPSGELIVTNF